MHLASTRLLPVKVNEIMVEKLWRTEKVFIPTKKEKKKARKGLNQLL